jgi:hypothetical protein
VLCDSRSGCATRAGERELGVCGVWLCSRGSARACYKSVSVNFGSAIGFFRVYR